MMLSSLLEKSVLGKRSIKLNHSRVSDLICYGDYSRDVYTLTSHETSLSQRMDRPDWISIRRSRT